MARVSDRDSPPLARPFYLFHIPRLTTVLWYGARASARPQICEPWAEAWVDDGSLTCALWHAVVFEDTSTPPMLLSHRKSTHSFPLRAPCIHPGCLLRQHEFRRVQGSDAGNVGRTVAHPLWKLPRARHLMIIGRLWLPGVSGVE